MQKIEGPACPKCGCMQSTLVRRCTEWGKLTERRRCDHCRRVFTAQPPDPEPRKMVDYPLPIACPRCDSYSVETVTTRLPLRSHKCRDCGWSFQSVDRRHAAKS